MYVYNKRINVGDEQMVFTDKELAVCYRFSQEMVGKHNRDMIMDRMDWEVFRDDFRGKLGEVALRNYIIENYPNVVIQKDIDYSVTPLGQWDTTDLLVNGVYINVKSVKENSNFLLIETKRYDENGNYTYQNNNGEDVRIDAYVLVRVSVEPDMNINTMKYRDVEQITQNHKIDAKLLGGISHKLFWKKKHKANKGIKCTFKNLMAICDGKENELPDLINGKENKNHILQQDNYILYKNELLPIKVFLQKDVVK